ncbi:MAG: sugar nucleotide-binding protein [Puniceicoccales bacterium]|jgi:dTDP-4-dehydrorhamnose reductase|nr:sugar nucleotide-binding protein [Puniceicoccales bacterium]
MKIVVTGATGFLGAEVVLSALRRGHCIVALGGSTLPLARAATGGDAISVRQLDLTRPDLAETLLLEEFPDAIINCVGTREPDGLDAAGDAAAAGDNAAAGGTAGDAEARATALNVEVPRRLARVAHHLSAKLVHISADSVFDGARGDYAHTDTPAPTGVFARTKADGERAVLDAARGLASVVRVPPLHGNSAGVTGGRSFHERLFARWAAGARPTLPDTVLRQPLDAGNLADVLVELCERPNLGGVWHWAGTTALTPFETARRIAERFGLDPAKFVSPAPPPPAANASPVTDATPAATAPTTAPATAPTTVSASPPPARRDLRLSLAPLAGKLRTLPLDFDSVLERLRTPPAFAAWLATQTGTAAGTRSAGAIPLLIKGRDF